ncbi:MAG TPA: hypothetical protein VMC03_03940, partial [Streptosporangiaceae bacterium]|nr:hypothetical protein [Streptosporangiaceae bacterium]
GVVLALTQQKHSDLILTACIFAAALIYYFAFVRPRGDRYWTVSGAAPDTEAAAAAGAGSPET